MSQVTDSSSSGTDDSSSSETEDSSSLGADNSSFFGAEDFSFFGTGGDECDIDDPIETSANGTPETSQESSVENEATPQDQDPAVLERALSQLKRVGWTGTIESFAVYQAKLLTKKRTKKTHAEIVRNETPEEREKRILERRGRTKIKTGTPEESEKRILKRRERAKIKYETKIKTETPEEREKRLEKLRIGRLKREAKRSEEEKKKITERRRNRANLRKANETLEQREKRTAWFREYQRMRYTKQPRPRKQLSETERAILLEKNKVRYALRKASETPEEREERLAKLRGNGRKRRPLSPESLEKLNARRRECYRKKGKLKKKPSSTEQNWNVKIEAVQSAVLEVPTENHSLQLEIAVEPDALQETLLTYVKEEINPTVSWVESSVTDSQALTSDLLTS